MFTRQFRRSVSWLRLRIPLRIPDLGRQLTSSHCDDADCARGRRRRRRNSLTQLTANAMRAMTAIISGDTSPSPRTTPISTPPRAARRSNTYAHQGNRNGELRESAFGLGAARSLGLIEYACSWGAVDDSSRAIDVREH